MFYAVLPPASAPAPASARARDAAHRVAGGRIAFQLACPAAEIRLAFERNPDQVWRFESAWLVPTRHAAFVERPSLS